MRDTTKKWCRKKLGVVSAILLVLGSLFFLLGIMNLKTLDLPNEVGWFFILIAGMFATAGLFIKSFKK